MIKKIKKYKPKEINVVKLKNYLDKMYNKMIKK